MSISHVSLGLTEGAWPRYSSDMKYKIQPIFKAKKYTETDNKILVLAPDVKRVFMFIGDIVGLHIGCIS